MDSKILLDFALKVNATKAFIRDDHYFMAKCSSVLPVVQFSVNPIKPYKPIKKDN